MRLYTEIFTLKISKTQKSTLQKLKSRNIRVSSFIRDAISEKIKREASELIEIPEEITMPF